MENNSLINLAPPIKKGIEDRFYYIISDHCKMCGMCVSACPTNAIKEYNGAFSIHKERCIDCGTCSTVCPVGAAMRVPYIRKSISVSDIDKENCYFNAGCAINLYKPEIAANMLRLLQKEFGNIKSHNLCCTHEPKLPKHATIINNCAGCDRRFRSLYEDVETISFWEVIDSIDGLELPDYGGIKMSIHDSCGYRHKPQVHEAIRSLLHKMNIEVVEAEFHGTMSVCCGDNFYGHVPNETVQNRIHMRANQFPCDDIVVYCIGCERAMNEAGKKPHYLPDLLCNQTVNSNRDTLDEYHSKLATYVEAH